MAGPDVLLRLHPNDDTLVDVRLDWAELAEGTAVIPMREALALRDRLSLAIEGAELLTRAHSHETSPGAAPVRLPAAPGDYPDAIEPEGD